MKQFALLFALAIVTFTLHAEDVEKEKQAIKQVIQTAYVDGIQNLGSIEEIEAGFHPGFNLLGMNQDDMLTKLPIYSWLESIEKRKAQNPEGRPEDEKITCKYNSIDVTGNAAMAKIELYQKDKKLFTDYLQLYKFEEGWKIVSKIYHRH
ncbi:MAG: nuclear transport factor 2 family protein [Bacteroidales bacterium]